MYNNDVYVYKKPISADFYDVFYGIRTHSKINVYKHKCNVMLEECKFLNKHMQFSRCLVNEPWYYYNRVIVHKGILLRFSTNQKVRSVVFPSLFCIMNRWFVLCKMRLCREDITKWWN